MKVKTKGRQFFSKKSAILLALLISFGLLIAIFAYFGMLQNNWMGELNEPILDWFSTHRTSSLNDLMQIATTTASPTFFVIIATGGAIFWAFKKREIWRPFLMTIAIIISATTSTILKLVIQNARPDRFDMVPPIETGFSFPSGHTLCTLVFLLTVGYLFYSRYKASDKHFWLIIWIIATVIGTSLIAITRLYLGYHWFTDVIGSIGIGLILFVVVILIDKLFIRNYKKLTVLI